MHRDEIEGNWWTIPVARSKNKQAHRVYLTPLALELIGEKDGFIFQSPANPNKSYEVQTLTHSIKDNLPHPPQGKVEDRLKIAHFTPHDLRRTGATCMAEMGIAGDIIDHVQNHITRQKQGVGHIYNRYSYDREKQAARESWERRLKNIIMEEPAKGGNVISIIRKKTR